MNPYVKNQKGVTLIELLAGLTIFSVIILLIYNTWIFGIKSYNRVNIEGQMRDEADIIMTNIMNELHELNPYDVEEITDSTTLPEELKNNIKNGSGDTSLPASFTTRFTTTNKHGLIEGTELVAGDNREIRLYITFIPTYRTTNSEGKIDTSSKIIFYKEFEEKENVFSPVNSSPLKEFIYEKQVIFNHKLDSSGEREKDPNGEFIMINPLIVHKNESKENNFINIEVFLMIQPTREYLEKTDTHRLELKSQFFL